MSCPLHFILYSVTLLASAGFFIFFQVLPPSSVAMMTAIHAAGKAMAGIAEMHAIERRRKGFPFGFARHGNNIFALLLLPGRAAVGGA